MPDTIVNQMNLVIAEWKNIVVDHLSNTFPNEHINTQELALKSWSDIIKTSYDLVQKVEGTSDDISDLDDLHLITNAVILSPVLKLQGFNRNTELQKFYQNAFGPARNFARSLFQEGVTSVYDDYSILPSDTPFNNGLPASLQNIIPNSIQIYAVSKNTDAHAVNDILLLGPISSIVIKAVPQLPKPALEWAKKNNVKVY